MTGAAYQNFKEIDDELADLMAELADDPYEWVKFAYEWGQGDLAGFEGPDDWQSGYLKEWGQEIRARGFDGIEPVMPYRVSTTSGHGVGKSALVGWAVGFIMSTRPHSKGIVSANSIPQLETKTWSEISKWMGRCITGRWFRITTGRGSLKIVHRVHPDTWRVDGMAWDETRPAAFAGLHAATGSPFFIFDEASEIARIILETALGGLTDGEPFFMMFSNPTAASGFFYDSHHDMRHRFKTYQIDSRTARMTNKQLINEWIKDFGIDSDFVKVRVLGEFPLTGDRQFIPSGLVAACSAFDREPTFGPNDPIILGVDVARYGDDESVIKIRRGRDMRSYPMKIFRGLDTNQLAHEVRRIAEKLLPDAINVDGTGIGAGVIDNLRAWGIPNVYEINFGGASPDPEYDDMATYMLGEMRKMMRTASCTIEDEPILKRQLTARQYWIVQSKKGTAEKVESKEELKKNAVKNRDTSPGAGSPDRADAHALTFATPVYARDVEKTKMEMAGGNQTNVVGVDYERT